MSLSSTSTVRCCARAIRPSFLRPPCAASSALSQRQRRAPSRRWETTAAASPSPKVSSIVDQISQLTLLETADLVSNLKSRLNIPDTPMGNFSAAATTTGPSSTAAAPAEEEEAAPAAQEKTLFALTLQSFGATSKPKVIKEVKSMLGLSLVDSKKFVESAPKLMKEGVPKEEGERVVETMKGLGAVVSLD
ncbi:50S ribosomal protein L12 [Usnea florida]